MIFSTQTASVEWSGQASELFNYYASVQRLEFSSASSVIETLGEIHKSRWESLTDSDPDQLYNDYYLFGVLLGLLRSYVTFWGKLFQEQFFESWSRLQDAQDRLRVLRKFGQEKAVSFLDAVEEQCGHLEKLYPYNLFMSIEATYEQLECSICGEDMNSLACPHIKGELYRGVLAAGIVRKVNQLHAASLVTNPRDKRCVIQYPDSGPQFRLVRFLASLLRERRVLPFCFARVQEKRVELTAGEKSRLSRNDRCPCGSSKKFKKCCLGKERIERGHLDLVGAEEAIVTANQLVHLNANPLPLLAGR